jgi:hypothetical protein
VIDGLVQRLVDALGPERIYLFVAYRALRGSGVSKDVLVWTADEFDRRRHLAASLPATILREGRLIYGG